MTTLKDEYILNSEAEMKELARNMAKAGFRRVALSGPLGAGKTVFAKGFFSFFGISEEDIISPSFTIVNEYKLAEKIYAHIDLYRYQRFIDDFGFWELAERADAMLVEWAEKIGISNGPFDLIIEINSGKLGHPEGRTVKVKKNLTKQ